jgi:hypothetical protein
MAFKNTVIIFGSVLFALSAGCQSEEVSYVPNVGIAAAPLFAETVLLWAPGKVPVCWENPSAVANSAALGWVRQAIARTWSLAGNLEFTGWGACPATSSGLRIRWMDTEPAALGQGTNLDGQSPGLYLNDRFQNFQLNNPPGYSLVITCTPTSTPAQLEACIENTAIHEFGHVLGFDHEENAPGASSRPDFPASCASHVGQPFGDVLYNNYWDLNSVMNTCSPAYLGPRLSATDFAGMMYFYGISPTYVAALVAARVI